MILARRLSLAHRRWLLLFLVAALCSRALVPAGWMPVADARGVSLALCDGDGPMMDHAMAMAMPHHHGGAPMQHHQGAPDHPCAFAVAAATFAPAWPAAPLPADLPRHQPPTTRFMVAVGSGLAAPPPPPTGPPAFV